MEVCAYMQQAQNSSNSACVLNWALLMKQGKSETAFHQYENACKNNDFLPCFENFAQLPIALFNPETSIFIQKHHPYTGNLNSETLGDSKNAFLHWGDGFGAQIALSCRANTVKPRAV